MTKTVSLDKVEILVYELQANISTKQINGSRKIHINFTHLRYPVGSPGFLLFIIAILILNNSRYTVSR